MNLDFSQIFNDFYASLAYKLPNILIALLVVVLFIIIGKLFYKFVGQRMLKKWKDTIISNFISEATKWAFYIFGIIVALNILGFGGIASGLLAGAGISAIIFGFAFKDIGENFLAGIILALKRPFEIGDIIEVEGFKGTVKDLDLRVTHLRNVEGKDIFIPNSSFIKNTVVNYTRDGNLRVSFMIGIAPECDIYQTKDLILSYLKSNIQVLKSPLPNVVVQELGEYTTNIQVLFWVDILAKRSSPDSNLGYTVRSKIISEVKGILDRNNIEMPSQVLEHKMYRDNFLNLHKAE